MSQAAVLVSSASSKLITSSLLESLSDTISVLVAVVNEEEGHEQEMGTAAEAFLKCYLQEGGKSIPFISSQTHAHYLLLASNIVDAVLVLEKKNTGETTIAAVSSSSGRNSTSTDIHEVNNDAGKRRAQRNKIKALCKRCSIIFGPNKTDKSYSPLRLKNAPGSFNHAATMPTNGVAVLTPEAISADVVSKSDNAGTPNFAQKKSPSTAHKRPPKSTIAPANSPTSMATMPISPLSREVAIVPNNPHRKGVSNQTTATITPPNKCVARLPAPTAASTLSPSLPPEASKNNEKDTRVTVYILECEGGRFYIGKTNNVQDRINQHKAGNGSMWTQKYPYVRTVQIIPKQESFAEDMFVKKYMHKYSIDKVRGGTYSQLQIPAETRAHLKKEILSQTDCCYRCGRGNHFSNKCQEHTDKVGKRLLTKPSKRGVSSRPSSAQTRATGRKPRYQQKNQHPKARRVNRPAAAAKTKYVPKAPVSPTNDVSCCYCLCCDRIGHTIEQCTARFNRHICELQENFLDLSLDDEASTDFYNQDDESSSASSESFERYAQRNNSDSRSEWDQGRNYRELHVHSDDDNDDADESHSDSDDDIIECYDNGADRGGKIRENGGTGDTGNDDDDIPAPKKARISHHDGDDPAS